MANYFDDHDDEGHTARTSVRKAEIERHIAAPLRARIAELEREAEFANRVLAELRDEVTTVRHDMAHAAEAAERDGYDDTAEAYRIVVARLDCAIAKGVLVGEAERPGVEQWSACKREALLGQRRHWLADDGTCAYEQPTLGDVLRRLRREHDGDYDAFRAAALRATPPALRASVELHLMDFYIDNVPTPEAKP